MRRFLAWRVTSQATTCRSDCAQEARLGGALKRRIQEARTFPISSPVGEHHGDICSIDDSVSVAVLRFR